MAILYSVSVLVRKRSPLELESHDIIVVMPGTVRGASTQSVV